MIYSLLCTYDQAAHVQCTSLDFMNFVRSRFAVLSSSTFVSRSHGGRRVMRWPTLHNVLLAALHACLQVDRLAMSRLVIRQNQIDADVRGVQLTTPADLGDIRLALLIHWFLWEWPFRSCSRHTERLQSSSNNYACIVQASIG